MACYTSHFLNKLKRKKKERINSVKNKKINLKNDILREKGLLNYDKKMQLRKIQVIKK